MVRQSHLSGCFWLFAPKFWEVAGTHKLFYCHSMNVGSGECSGGVAGTLKPYHVLMDLFELIPLKDGGDTKTLGASTCARARATW